VKIVTILLLAIFAIFAFKYRGNCRLNLERSSKVCHTPPKYLADLGRREYFDFLSGSKTTKNMG
jgi:hypothetical protein